MSSGNLITRIYSGFRGVDFRGEEINLVRSPDSLNIWKDYKETESIRTRPEMELLESFDETVWGVFFYASGDINMLLVHSGTKLYKIVDGERTELYTGLNPARSASFIFNAIFKRIFGYFVGQSFFKMIFVNGIVLIPIILCSFFINNKETIYEKNFIFCFNSVKFIYFCSKL